MSELSEKCYKAGWLSGSEYFVPELCRRALATGQSQRWGHGSVKPADAQELTGIAHQLGHWVTLDETGSRYVLFDPFPIPADYVASLDRENAVPNGAGE